MSEQIIILKNSSAKGRIPTTRDLQFGELALNTNSGKLFLRRTDRVVDEIVSIGSDINQSQKIEKTNAGVQLNLDVQNRQAKEITLNTHTAIQFNNPPPADSLVKLNLFVFNNGDYAITWMNQIIWEDGEAPMLANNAWTIIELFVTNQKYFGVVKASNMKEAQ